MASVAGPSSTAPGPSSDDDFQMIDSTGGPIPPSIDVDAATSNPDADGDDDDDLPPEDEYEIERIVSHSQEPSNGQLSYYVAWKGYPDSENSWVFEQDMGGAQEMIQEYWAKVPKKAVKKMGTKGGRNGKRQSSVGAAVTPVKSQQGRKRGRRESSLLSTEQVGSARKVRKNGVSGLSGELAPSRSPSPDDALVDTETDPAIQRIQSDPTLTDDQRETLIAQYLHGVKLDRLRKRYARIADWDPIVKRIEAVEKMSDGKLRVFIHFESGDRLAFESVVAHHRCPLKLLQFYESNLRFKRKDGEGEDEEVGEPLRGEEEQRELEEYLRSNEGHGVQAEGEPAVEEGEGETGVVNVNGTGEELPSSSVGAEGMADVSITQADPTEPETQEEAIEETIDSAAEAAAEIAAPEEAPAAAAATAATELVTAPTPSTTEAVESNL